MLATAHSSSKRFVAIERTVEFRLLGPSTMQPEDPPGTHPDVHREATEARVLGESMAANLANPCCNNRSKPTIKVGSPQQRVLKRCRNSPPRFIHTLPGGLDRGTSVSARRQRSECVSFSRGEVVDTY